MNILNRLRLKWRLRGIATTPINTMAIPIGQHEQLTADQKWAQEHGFSAATTPDVATPEIAAHNLFIDREYDAEIERRKALMAEGAYTPRFFLVDYQDDGSCVVSKDVNWHLELTLDPGRRANVTRDTGRPVILTLSPDEQRQQREIDRLKGKVQAVESAKDMEPAELLAHPALVRALVGDRATVLAACGGNEAMADQVEAKAVAVARQMREAFPTSGKV